MKDKLITITITSDDKDDEPYRMTFDTNPDNLEQVDENNVATKEKSILSGKRKDDMRVRIVDLACMELELEVNKMALGVARHRVHIKSIVGGKLF